METNYTKGNWYLQEFTDAYTNIVRCDNGTHKTLFIASTPQNSGDEARANAKLMAASPNLLFACNYALQGIKMGQVDELTVKILEDAISKALL
jgi:hypothetical protein